MKSIFAFVLTLLFANAVATALLSPYFPHSLFNRDPSLNIEIKAQIEQQHPTVFIIGNSLVERGLDVPSLESLTGYQILHTEHPGSMSAVWYLIFKNNVAAAEPPPAYTVFVFKDNVFSVPGYTVQGRSTYMIDEFAGPEEPVLDQLAYLNYMSPAEVALSRQSLFFRNRLEIREWLLAKAKYPFTTAFFGKEERQVDKAIETMFEVENIDVQLLGQVDQNVQTALLNTQYDFYESMETSFLPFIVDIAEREKIHLIFVRYRARHYVEFPGNKDDMDVYFADMEQYLNEHGATLVDFSADLRLQLQHYADGDHLNRDGVIVFTEMLADALREIIENPK